MEPSQETVTRLLAAAERNIKDAQVAAVSAENRFDAAYKAVMQLGTGTTSRPDPTCADSEISCSR
jgi:hypothetical protein